MLMRDIVHMVFLQLTFSVHIIVIEQLLFRHALLFKACDTRLTDSSVVEKERRNAYQMK